MLPSLDGVRLKLQRAYQQLDILKGEITAFLERKPYVPAFNLRRVHGATEASCVIDFAARRLVNRLQQFYAPITPLRAAMLASRSALFGVGTLRRWDESCPTPSR